MPRGFFVSETFCIIARMKTERSEIEQQWEAAQAAVRAAMNVPGGTERIAALKKAGQLRFEADKRRRAFEEDVKNSR
jgi:hypothetical protein